MSPGGIRRFQPAAMPALLLAAFMGLGGCSPNPESVVVIGSKLDTEGAILGYVQLLALQVAQVHQEHLADP